MSEHPVLGRGPAQAADLVAVAVDPRDVIARVHRPPAVLLQFGEPTNPQNQVSHQTLQDPGSLSGSRSVCVMRWQYSTVLEPTSAARDQSTGASLDAQTATRALLGVLDHPDVATDTDERLLEALLLHGLRCVPGLGDSLFSCGPDVEFWFGEEGHADIVGWRGEVIVVECEVKTRAKLNEWASGSFQLDVYAENSPEARLYLLTTERHQTRLNKKLLQVRALNRWSMLWLSELREKVSEAASQFPPSDGSVERLARAVARLF